MPNITPSSKGGTSQDSSDLLAKKKRDIQLAVLRSKTSKGGQTQVSNLQMGYDNGFYSLFSQKGLEYESINQTPNVIYLTDANISLGGPVESYDQNGDAEPVDRRIGSNSISFNFNSQLPVTIYNNSSQDLYLTYYDPSATNSLFDFRGLGGSDPALGTLFSVSGSGGIPAGGYGVSYVLPQLTKEVRSGRLLLSTRNSFTVTQSSTTYKFYIGSMVLAVALLPSGAVSYTIPNTFTGLGESFFANSQVGVVQGLEGTEITIPPSIQNMPIVPGGVTIKFEDISVYTKIVAKNPYAFGNSPPPTVDPNTGQIIPITVPFTGPVRPEIVRVIPGDQSVSLEWTEPYNGGSPILGYIVTMNNVDERVQLTYDTQNSATPTAREYTWPDLINGYKYRFSVHAYNSIDSGTESIDSAIVIPIKPLTISDAPTSLEIIQYQPTALTLSWSPPKIDGGSPVITYFISVIASDGSLINKSTPETTYKVDGLVQGIQYTFVVKALNINGLSSESESITATTPQLILTTPSKPNAPTLIAGFTNIILYYIPPANIGSSPIIENIFKIYDSTLQLLDTRTIPFSTDGYDPAQPKEYKWTGLITGKMYTFTVTARNSVGDSDESDQSLAEKPIDTLIPYPIFDDGAVNTIHYAVDTLAIAGIQNSTSTGTSVPALFHGSREALTTAQLTPSNIHIYSDIIPQIVYYANNTWVVGGQSLTGDSLYYGSQLSLGGLTPLALFGPNGSTNIIYYANNTWVVCGSNTTNSVNLLYYGSDIANLTPLQMFHGNEPIINVIYTPYGWIIGVGSNPVYYHGGDITNLTVLGADGIGGAKKIEYVNNTFMIINNSNQVYYGTDLNDIDSFVPVPNMPSNITSISHIYHANDTWVIGCTNNGGYSMLYYGSNLTSLSMVNIFGQYGGILNINYLKNTWVVGGYDPQSNTSNNLYYGSNLASLSPLSIFGRYGRTVSVNYVDNIWLLSGLYNDGASGILGSNVYFGSNLLAPPPTQPK